MLELHVATNGRDDADGAPDTPLATLEGARDALRQCRQGREGATIWVHGGLYQFDRPLALTAEDSGAEGAPVRCRAWPREAVVLSGGREIGGFEPVVDAAVRERLDLAARDHVVQTDLRAQGIDDLGEAVTAGKRLELFFAEQPMTLARWPNEGFSQIARVLGLEPFECHGIEGDHAGVFTYDGDRPRRWQAEDDVWLLGYWFWDWADAYQQVASIDPEQRRIELAQPPHHYGYRPGQRWYAANLLCELDAPGEWYLDRRAGILYFWPPTPIEGNRITVSVLPELLHLDGVSHVSFEGLTLEASRATAISIEGGAGCVVRDCTTRNVGGWGVKVSGGRRHRVEHCCIHHPGEGGVSLSGGDFDSLTPAEHLAAHNHIHHFSRLVRTYRPGVGVNGVGIRVAHNHIHDAPHSAILLGGNEHLIEFNEIHHVCAETGDVGAFYMGRDWTARGTVIRHNYFHHIKGPGLWGANAVYLDDAASGIRIEGNVFYQAAKAAFIGGGRDNLVANNVFVDCQAAVHVDARGLGWMHATVEPGGIMPERLAARPIDSPVWRARYPQLPGLLDDEPAAPKYNRVERNISWRSQWLDVEDKAMPYLHFADNLVDEDPRFIDEANGDFRLRADSPAVAMGFEPIPTEQIGPQPPDA